jgi:hypothetical protein
MNHETLTSVPAVKKGKVSGLKKLIREVESDDEDETPVLVVHTDASKPWMTEFTRYLETLEAALASGMCKEHYQIWHTLGKGIETLRAILNEENRYSHCLALTPTAKYPDLVHTQGLS